MKRGQGSLEYLLILAAILAIAVVVVPPIARRIIRRGRVAALEREPLESQRGMPRGLDRRGQERRRSGVKRAWGRGPAVAIQSVGDRDLLANSPQVAWTGVTVGPAHGGEE